MHQRGLDWTCLRRCPRQTPARSSGSQGQTHGTVLQTPPGLQDPRTPPRSLR